MTQKELEELEIYVWANEDPRDGLGILAIASPALDVKFDACCLHLDVATGALQQAVQLAVNHTRRPAYLVKVKFAAVLTVLFPEGDPRHGDAAA